MSGRTPAAATLGLVRSLAPVLAVGAAGGFVFAQIGVPLAWLLGALVACMLVCVFARPLTSPRRIRPQAAVVLGLTIGASFTPEVLRSMAAILPSLALVVPFTALVAVLGMLYLRRVAGYDRITAAYGALPGGLSEVTLLAEETKADLRRIAMIHAARITVTIAVLSGTFALLWGPVDPLGPLGTAGTPPARAAADWMALAGLLVAGLGAWRGAARMGIPAAHLLGPFFLSAALHGSGLMAVVMPTVLVAAAQVVVGATIGCRFVGARLGELVAILGHGVALVLGVLALSLGLALAVAQAVPLPVPLLMLSYAPGGLTELSLLAMAVGLEASVVATHHLVRQLCVVFAAPFIRRLAEGPAQAGEGPDPDHKD